MFLRSFKLFAAALIAAVLTVACGNDSPPPAPTGLTVSASESAVTVSWDVTDGAEYWLFFGPTSLTPASTTSMQGWFGLPGGNVILKASSPYVISGLANALSYSISVNARTNGGPGGPGATAVVVTPRIAGNIWSAGAATGSTDLRGITFGATAVIDSTTVPVSTYVAAGAGGAVYTSLDASTWSAVNYAGASNINGAAYFGSFKLVGDGGLVLMSSDAKSWTAQNSGTTQNLYAIASNYLNLNVAVGANGTIITSSDGVTWSAASNPATSSDLYAVTYSTYNGGTWVAVGAGGAMVQSTDGLTWKSVATSTTADLRGITYGITSVTTGAGAFVAVGAAATVLASSDGASWTAQTLTGGSALNAVTFGTQFVAVGAGGSIFVSADGAIWSAVASGSSQNLYAVTRGSLNYAAVGAAGSNLMSK